MNSTSRSLKVNDLSWICVVIVSPEQPLTICACSVIADHAQIISGCSAVSDNRTWLDDTFLTFIYHEGSKLREQTLHTSGTSDRQLQKTDQIRHKVAVTGEVKVKVKVTSIRERL